jgi:release factor H-coupled RctB family protein
MNELLDKEPKVRLIASDGSWIEGEAFQQLNKAAALDGMQAAVGLPDLHPGRGNPIGAAFLSRHVIYPYLVGNDVGCGIGLWQTTLKTNKVKRDKWVRKLNGLEHHWDGDVHSWLQQFGLEASDHDMALGTIGRGNHFAELQQVEKIDQPAEFHDLNMDPGRFYLLVHSGSRGMGEHLLRQHTERFGAGGLAENSVEAQQYMEAHGRAIKWAGCSRALIARRFSEQLNADSRPVLDVIHNSIEKVDLDGQHGWLHRKGAAPSTAGPIVVPGSRGALSYLVKPVGDQRKNLWSLAHGAGRKWNRKSCKERLRARTTSKALSQTKMGNVVICDDKDMLFEEAPEAYKKIETVIHDMVTQGLIEVIATLRPLITYKTRN